MGQHAPQALLLGGGDAGPEGRVAFDVEVVHLGLAREALGGVGVAVGVGNIGLDVVDGGAVHEVGSPHDEDGAHVGTNLDFFQLDAGQAQRIGPEGRAGGENAHAGVAAEAGRADRGRPGVPHGPGELPDQPDVAEIFQTADGVRVAVLGGEDNFAPQAVHKAALARDAELGGKGGVDVGDDLQGHIFGCFHLINLCRSRRRGLRFEFLPAGGPRRSWAGRRRRYRPAASRCCPADGSA